MKKYILIYAYTFFTEDEISFWNSLSSYLNSKGYHIFLLASVPSKSNLLFENASFTEKLSKVKIGKKYCRLYKVNPNIIEREEIWYGKSKTNLRDAYFTQKSKYSILLKELNPCYALIANGQHAGDMILINQLKKFNVRFSYLERGCISKTWHIDIEGITAGTRVAKLKMNELNYSGKDNFNLYAKDYFKGEEEWWTQPTSSWSREMLYQRFRIDKDLPVILFANQLDNDTSNFLYSKFFKNNVEAFEWLIKNLVYINFDCFVIIKKHPHFHGSSELFENILSNYKFKGAWVEDIPLKDCIEFSNFVCAVNSTMILDGFMHKKPTLTLGKSIYSNKNIFWQIEDIDDLGTLNSWLNAERLKERLNNFEVFLSYMIENELFFFSKKSKQNGFLDFESFADRLIELADVDKLGRFPKGYISLENQTNISIFQKVINRIVRFLVEIKKSTE